MRPVLSGGRRVSIAGLMLAVLVVGGEIAVLRDTDRLGTVASAAVVVAALMWATLLAGVGRGPRRPFWFGFAAFGWAHLFLLDSPYDEALPTVRLMTAIEERYVAATVPPSEPVADRELAYDRIHAAGYGILPWLSLPAGVVGGLVATWMHRREGREVGRCDPA